MAASATKRARPKAGAKTKATATKASTKKDTKAPEEKKPGKRELEKARKAEEAEKVRKAKLESGDLVIVGDKEFEKTSKDTKTYLRAKSILSILDKANGNPIPVADVATELGAFYEDVLPQFAMLEAMEYVVRFEGSRRAVAYRKA